MQVAYAQALMARKEKPEAEAKTTQSTKFGNALRRLMERQGWDVNKLADATGINRSLVSRHLNGWVFPHLRTRRDYSEALKMSIMDFEQFWREFTIHLTQGGPGIPVINRTPAGEVVDYHECSEKDSGGGHYYIDRSGISDPNAFAVVVTGDSMTGELEDGDEAIFSPLRLDGKPISGGKALEDDEIVHVRFTPEFNGSCCTIAYYRKLVDGSVLLQKKNTRKYKAIVCKTTDIARLSVLVQRRTNPRGRGLTQMEGHLEASATKEGLTPRPDRGEESQIPENWE